MTSAAGQPLKTALDRIDSLARPQRPDDLCDPDDDKRHAGDNCQQHDRIERPGDHYHSGEDAHHAEKYVPAALGQLPIANGQRRLRDALENEADPNPDGQQYDRPALIEVAEGEHTQDDRQRPTDEQQHAPGQPQRER